jgi:hypothetical protein
VITLAGTLKRRAVDVLAYFDRPCTSNGPTEAINGADDPDPGCLEHGVERAREVVLREYEDFYNSHRPHRALAQAAPLRPFPDGVTDLDHFRVRRHDRAGGVFHEYRLVA